MPPSRRNKYGAKAEVVDGLRFDSGGEARRYEELCLLQVAGHVRDLRIHVPYPIVVNETYVCRYEADFVYELLDDDGRWRGVVEDCKGFRTDVYKLKAKLMLAVHGIEILETVPPSARRNKKKMALL